MHEKSSKDYTVIKIGGSFLEKKEIISSICSSLMNTSKKGKFRANLGKNHLTKFVLVFGGGRRAEKIRINYREDKNRNRSELLYHFKAIECMDQNAEDSYKFIINADTTGNLSKNAIITNNLIDIKKKNNRIFFLKPLNLLKTVPQEIIPFSWQVTSDSIAIYISFLLGVDNVILLKQRDYFQMNKELITHINSTDLLHMMEQYHYINNLEEHLGKATNFPIDPYSPRLIKKHRINTILLNGNNTGILNETIKKIKSDDLDSIVNFGTLITP
jgi:aspartokinase-like uncharacterized kinase